MRGKFALILALILAPSAQAAITCPAAGAIASEYSGYAPLAVFFDATATTDGNSSIPFQEDYYVWDFADTGAGTWAFSGQSKNAATGGVAAHVFETAGTYAVTLNVSNVAGQTCSVTLSNIVVAATTDTLTGTWCFSTTSDFTGCPGGATQVQQSNFNTIMSTYMQTNRRLLLHAGQTFTATSEAAHQQGPWMLASFGSGAKPIISTSASSLLNLYNRNHVVLQDLDIRGTIGSAGSGNDLCGSYNLLLRVDVQGFDNNSVCDVNGVPPWPGFHNITWVDGVWGGYGGYNAFFGGNYWAVMGMDLGLFVGPNTSEGHNLRPQVLQYSVMQHNKFEPQNYSGFKHQLKWHSGLNTGTCTSCTHSSQFNILSYNTVYGGPSNVAIWQVSIEPDNPDDDMRHNDEIIENNYISASAGGYGASASQDPVRFSGTNSTFRNNIVDASASSVASKCFAVGRRGVEPDPGSNRFYNNTCVYRGSNTGFTAFATASTGGSVFRNNLFYVTAGSPSFGGSDTIDHNVTDTSGSPFVNANWAAPTDYQITSPNTDVIGAGTSVPVLADYGGTLRGAAWDIGAWEYEAPPSSPTRTRIRAAQSDLFHAALALLWEPLR